MRNLSFSLHSFPSPVQHSLTLSERQVLFRRLAELPLFYGKYCDPTSSLRGDQHLRGPIEPLIWSSLLSQPFSSFHQNFLARSPWEASAANVIARVRETDIICDSGETLMRTGRPERKRAELHINPATWKWRNSKYSATLQTLLPKFKSHSFPTDILTAWIMRVPLQEFNHFKGGMK